MIYFARVDSTTVKIGFTTGQDLRSRMAQLSRRYGRTVELLAFIENGDRELERYLHSRFAGHRLGRREHFRLSPEILEFIRHPLLMAMEGPVEPNWLDSPLQSR